MNLKVVEDIIRESRKVTLVAGCLSLGLLFLPSADAEPLSTDNYRLDPNVSNSFGGLVSSDSYELLDSGGEAVIGLGDSPSYKLSQGYVSQLEQSIELSLLPDGLEGYWPLNTGAGIQAYDVSANDNRGVIEGDPGWIDGQVGRGALELDGGNDFVYVDSYSGLDVSEFSVSAWFRNDESASGLNTIVSKQGVDAHEDRNFWVVVDTDDSFEGDGVVWARTSSGGESAVDLVSSEGYNDGEWHHVVLTHSPDNNEARLYINGELEDEQTTDVDSPDGQGGLFSIAAQANGSINDVEWYFEGAIDEVKIYSRPLSRDEVIDEYSVSSSGIANALTLPSLDPGQSRSVGADAVVRTDAGGYSIAIEQDGDLRTDQGDTIPAIESSISFPSPWNEGATTGFGFSVLDGVQRDGKWGSEPDFEYAAIPSSSTSFHSRDGLSGGEKEVTSLEFRAGIDSTQAAGIYRNRLGFTATLKP